MSIIDLAFMQRYQGELGTAIKNYVKSNNLNEKGNSIPADTDLNTLNTAGIFHIADDTVAESLSNLPLSVCGKILVQDNGNNGMVQFYIPNHSPRIFQRLWWDNSWTNWVELATTDYVNTLMCTENTAGTYVLKATVSSQGTVTYSWEEET